MLALTQRLYNYVLTKHSAPERNIALRCKYVAHIHQPYTILAAVKHAKSLLSSIITHVTLICYAMYSSTDPHGQQYRPVEE